MSSLAPGLEGGGVGGGGGQEGRNFVDFLASCAKILYLYRGARSL